MTDSHRQGSSDILSLRVINHEGESGSNQSLLQVSHKSLAVPVRDQRTKALIAINCYALGTAVSSIFFKRAMAKGCALLDFFLFRNISMLLVSTMWILVQGLSPFGKDFPTDWKWILLARCFTSQMGFFLFNLCLALIPMTYVIIIFQTSGFWASLLARVLFKEPMSSVETLGLFICFACVVVITLAGTQDAPRGDDEEVQKKDTISRAAEIFGFVIMIITSWVYAFNCILNRALKQVNAAVIIFYSGCFGFTVAACILLVEHFLSDRTGGIRVFHYDRSQYMLLVGAMLFDTMANFGATIAFQADSAGFIALVSYVCIVYGFLADLLLFEEKFSAIELLALTVMMSTILGISINKIRQRNLEKAKEDLKAQNASISAKAIDLN